MLGRIASYIFFITILAASQFADDGSCEDIIEFDLSVVLMINVFNIVSFPCLFLNTFNISVAR